ncbi:MAG TPA: glycosyltransferase, partial [Ktedonobacteraceae bacterium]|nr:glycosyltransferase [Ktedonobacteraceae bacterium]
TLIAVSQNCAQTYASFTSIDAVIYNGLSVARVPFQADIPADAPLLFVGRISPEKGVETAINIAERAGRPLRIIGGIYNQSYYHQKIAPRIARSAATISYLGLMEREQVWENMGQAAGLLCPVAWDEAFGLTSIEAMACGTPVIAFRRGAMEEVILHGQTGFLATPDDEKLAAEFAARLPEISRARCREYVEERFSLEKMISAYEQLYQRCIARSNLPGIA